MRNRALSIMAGLITSGLLVGATAAAGSAAAASRPGSLDPSFGTGGISVTNTGTTGVASDAARLPNGDIVVSGSFGVMRFLPGGQVDKTFGAGGLAQTRFRDLGLGRTGVAVQPDGKIVWVGDETTQVSGGDITDFAVARFNPNGTLDAGFGTNGQATTEFSPPRWPAPSNWPAQCSCSRTARSWSAARPPRASCGTTQSTRRWPGSMPTARRTPPSAPAGAC